MPVEEDQDHDDWAKQISKFEKDDPVITTADVEITDSNSDDGATAETTNEETTDKVEPTESGDGEVQTETTIKQPVEGVSNDTIDPAKTNETVREQPVDQQTNIDEVSATTIDPEKQSTEESVKIESEQVQPTRPPVSGEVQTADDKTPANRNVPGPDVVVQVPIQKTDGQIQTNNAIPAGGEPVPGKPGGGQAQTNNAVPVPNVGETVSGQTGGGEDGCCGMSATTKLMLEAPLTEPQTPRVVGLSTHYHAPPMATGQQSGASVLGHGVNGSPRMLGLPTNYRAPAMPTGQEFGATTLSHEENVSRMFGLPTLYYDVTAIAIPGQVENGSLHRGISAPTIVADLGAPVLVPFQRGPPSMMGLPTLYYHLTAPGQERGSSALYQIENGSTTNAILNQGLGTAQPATNQEHPLSK
eukprot:983940_1